MTSSMAGRHLMTQLYLSCLTPLSRRRKQVYQAFHDFGWQLAQFHGQDTGTSNDPVERHTPHEEFQTALKNHPPNDRACQELVDLLQATPTFTLDSYIHANLRRDNVVFDASTLGLIDFEDAGLGSRYHDLSRVGANFLLTQSVWAFPRNSILKAAKNFFSGYKRVSGWDVTELNRSMQLRLATTYIKVAGGHKETVCGIPISKRKLARILNQLRNGQVNAIF